MKRLVGFLLAVGFASTTALGGTVEFSNPVPADSGVLLLDPGASGTFDITVSSSTLDAALSLDAIFLADFNGPEADSGSRSLQFTGFDFSTAFTNGTFTQSTNAATTQVDGAREFKIGGLALDPPFGSGPFDLPIMVGTLHILVPNDLAPGDYIVQVSNNRETNHVSVLARTGFANDPLSGQGTVRVTPEPATLALLGIGGLIALRRRRRSA